MPVFDEDESGEGEPENPATFEEFKLVESGRGTPEQKARVQAALSDPASQLNQTLNELTRLFTAVSWRNRTPSEDASFWGKSRAGKNLARLIDYLRHKQDSGALSEEDVSSMLKSSLSPLSDNVPTPTQCAMAVSRTITAVCKLHPELASEVRSIPLTSGHKRS